ncbi:hypothetical protein SB758_34445, partial [Burkholderia sp. SIMBA_013]
AAWRIWHRQNLRAEAFPELVMNSSPLSLHSPLQDARRMRLPTRGEEFVNQCACILNAANTPQYKSLKIK